jgi:hypothetical protein
MVFLVSAYGQSNLTLRNELLHIYRTDQERPISMMDSDFMSKWRKQTITDSLNMIRIAAILDSIGYPGKSMVGDTAYTAAFFVVQHSNLKNREKYIPLIRNAAEKNEIEWKYVAMMIDRIQTDKHEKQIYGTQLRGIKDPNTGFATEKLKFFPIEDPANVNQRRKQVGLSPIEEYARIFGIEYIEKEHSTAF